MKNVFSQRVPLNVLLLLLSLGLFGGCKTKLIQQSGGTQPNTSKEEEVNNKGFPGMKYDKVVAYPLNGEQPTVLDNGRLSPSVKDTIGIKLNRTEANELLELLNDKDLYGGMIARCFIPHVGYVFYKDGVPVAQVNVCFQCNVLTSEPRIPALEASLEQGFSEMGKTALFRFEEKIGLR